MTEKKKKRSSRDYLDNLINLISEAVENDPEELKRSLEKEGMNIEELRQEGVDLAKKLEQEQIALIARQKGREILLQVIVEYDLKVRKLSEEELLLMLISVFPEGEYEERIKELRKLQHFDVQRVLEGFLDLY